MKRSAAITACASLVVGALMPFMFSSDASAAGCTTQSSSYSLANANVAAAKHHVKKAKKRLKKDKRHHKAASVIRKDRTRLKHARHHLDLARKARTYYYSELTVCQEGVASPAASVSGTTEPSTSPSSSPSSSPSTSPSASPSTSPSSSTSPSGSTSPVTTDVLTQLLQALTGSGLSSAALVHALDQISSQLNSSGAPGAAQLAAVIDQLAAAIANGSGSIDPSQLQAILSQLPSGVDPAAFQAALTQALAALQASMANPPTTASGLINAILTPLAVGCNGAGITALGGAITSIQAVLDGLLAGLGL